MGMLKVADLLVFVASARSSLCQQTHSHYIDSFGAQCLSVFRSLGLPTTLLFLRISYHLSSFFNLLLLSHTIHKPTIILSTNFVLNHFFVLCFQDLPTDLRQRNELKKICSSSLASEFPEDCKCYPADTKDDLHKVIISPIVGSKF
jgi:pre-rRNA-processing protein TSR1